MKWKTNNMEKINEIKSWFVKEVVKIDKPLVRPIRKKNNRREKQPNKSEIRAKSLHSL